MTTSEFWNHVKSLEGSTVHSVAQHKAYDVVDVAGDQIELYLHDGGKTRILFRNDLEPFFRKLVTSGRLDTIDLRTVYNFNVPVAAAILSAMPGVTTTTRPITLHYARAR